MSNDLTKYEVNEAAEKAGFSPAEFLISHQDALERFSTLRRADLVAENAALKEQLKALGVYNESTKAELARVQAVAEWQGSADGGKSWRRIDKPRGESIESRVAYLRNMTNSQGRPIYLIRALYTTPQPAAQEPTSAVPVVEPVAWSHGCNALCANIDLWISSCPHCGKPRPAAPVPQEQTSAVPVVEQLVEALDGLTKTPNDDSPESVAHCILFSGKAIRAIAAGQQYLKENGK